MKCFFGIIFPQPFVHEIALKSTRCKTELAENLNGVQDKITRPAIKKTAHRHLRLRLRELDRLDRLEHLAVVPPLGPPPVALLVDVLVDRLVVLHVRVRLVVAVGALRVVTL